MNEEKYNSLNDNQNEPNNIQKNDTSPTVMYDELKSRVLNIEEKLKNVKDSELFNVFLFSKSEDLFKNARNKLVLWISPILIALLILGFNIYDSNNKISKMHQNAKNELQNFSYFFKDETRIKTLKMLLANFYTIKSIRIPLGFVIDDLNHISGYNKSKIDRINATISKEFPTENRNIITGEIEYNSSNFPSTISVTTFYPSEYLDIKGLENYNFLNFEIVISLDEDYKYQKAHIANPYTYTGYLSSTMINGVRLFDENDNIENDFRKLRYPYSFSRSFSANGSKLICNISFKISIIVSNAKSRYENSHLN